MSFYSKLGAELSKVILILKISPTKEVGTVPVQMFCLCYSFQIPVLYSKQVYFLYISKNYIIRVTLKKSFHLLSFHKRKMSLQISRISLIKGQDI